MRRYRVGLVLLAAILIFVGLIVWYIVLAVTTDYTYEVQLEQQDGTTIPISNTDNEAEPATSAEAVELVVINQTNQPAAVANLENRLAGQPITIIEQFEPVETVKERSVLVYDPDNLEELNTLQAALPGVLVSSFDRTNEDEPPLLLYIGNDLLSP